MQHCVWLFYGCSSTKDCYTRAQGSADSLAVDKARTVSVDKEAHVEQALHLSMHSASLCTGGRAEWGGGQSS